MPVERGRLNGELIGEGRLAQLTGLRALAALLVFLSHSNVERISPLAHSVFQQGYVGVSFFFVLSGFVLAYSYGEAIRSRRMGWREYVALRAARLLPLHLLTSLPIVAIMLVTGAFDPDDLLGVMARYPGLYYPEQDALNIVLGRRCHFVDNRWNQTGATFWETAEEQSGLPSEAFRRLREEPWIVHFTSRPKPWQAGCSHPFQPACEKASAQTHGVRRRPMWNCVLRAFRRLRRDGYNIASRSRQRQV